MRSFVTHFIGTAWAQTASNAPTAANKSHDAAGILGMIMPMALVFLIFYFLLVRPQQRERKKHEGLLKNLKKGDAVITSAGIHGVVTSVNDTVITLEIAENIRIKLEKTQVAKVKEAA